MFSKQKKHIAVLGMLVGMLVCYTQEGYAGFGFSIGGDRGGVSVGVGAAPYYGYPYYGYPAVVAPAPVVVQQPVVVDQPVVVKKKKKRYYVDDSQQTPSNQ